MIIIQNNMLSKGRRKTAVKCEIPALTLQSQLEETNPLYNTHKAVSITLKKFVEGLLPLNMQGNLTVMVKVVDSAEGI